MSSSRHALCGMCVVKDGGAFPPEAIPPHSARPYSVVYIVRRTMDYTIVGDQRHGMAAALRLQSRTRSRCSAAATRAAKARRAPFTNRTIAVGAARYPTQSTRAIPHAKSHTHKPTHARAHAHTSHVHAFHARARRQSPPAGGAPESIRDGRRRLDQPHVVPPEPARLPKGHHRLPKGHHRLPMAPHFRAKLRRTTIACGLW